MDILLLNVAATGGAVYVVNKLIKDFTPVFIQKKLYGVDQCKTSGAPVAEPMGVIVAAVYLICLCIFLPVPFHKHLTIGKQHLFPCHNFVEFLSGILSISCVVLLGFADDVIDLKWRHKFLLPAVAAAPMLTVYWANNGGTTVMLPAIISHYVGATAINIGILYYVYMTLLAIFCTHAINILAGINGLEAGQSLVIAVSVAIFNVVQLYRLDTQEWYHYLSLFFLMPYIGVTAVLLRYNWCPASVFVGDTFCYWSGMTLSVVAIQGHFAKTMMLFFVPQILNFLYSTPQIFKQIPCPRHRLPKLDKSTGLMTMSMAIFTDEETTRLGRFIIAFLHKLGFLHVRERVENGVKYTEVNNMTLINLALKFFGPMHEERLTLLLLGAQCLNSLLAFGVRFGLAKLVYDTVQ